MKKIGLILVLTLFFLGFGFGKSYEFVNQEISEILYGISIAENISIIGDDTISGKGSFRFYGDDFESAFDSFLMANRLYVEKNGNTWTVSKIRLNFDNGKYNFDCYDVTIEKILEYISEKTNQSIISNSLPTTKNSYHISGVSLEELVSLIMKNWPDYKVAAENNVLFIEKEYKNDIDNNFSAIENQESKLEIKTIEDGFSVSLRNIEFDDFLKSMEEKENFQFISLVKDNPKINWAKFNNKSFEEVLKSLCSICEVSFTKKDQIYIFYSNYEESENLIETRDWNNYSLENISPEDFLPLFQNRFQKLQIIQLSSRDISIKHSKDDGIEILDFIKNVDVKDKEYLLEFKYICADLFLENLPKDYSEEDFYSTGLPSALFFYGSEKKYESLLEVIETIDKPTKRLSYDLLILQSQKSTVENWNSSLKASRLSSGNRTEASLILSPNFSFNLDLVQAFGYLFASEIQASIQENETEIFADTTLVGVSGVPISFKNTNTFRYREPYFNLENGNQIQSGVTREIVSGLVLEILGDVSGNGTITTSITASVSRRGADVANSSGNPPPTSEKVITTQVVGKSGDVIVLSGLVQNDSTFVEEKTPWLSKIPFIGKFFSKDAENTEKTEMIIYLVPHLETDLDVISEKTKNNPYFYRLNDFIRETTIQIKNKLFEK